MCAQACYQPLPLASSMKFLSWLGLAELSESWSSLTAWSTEQDCLRLAFGTDFCSSHGSSSSSHPHSGSSVDFSILAEKHPFQVWIWIRLPMPPSYSCVLSKTQNWNSLFSPKGWQQNLSNEFCGADFPLLPNLHMDSLKYFFWWTVLLTKKTLL